MVESLSNGKAIIAIKNLDMFGGDFDSKDCESEEQARELAQEYVKDPSLCATWAYQNKLWIKKIQDTKPDESSEKTHSKCISYFMVEDYGSAIEKLDFIGGDINQVEVDGYDDAKYHAMKMLESSKICATFNHKTNVLAIKLIQKTNPSLSTNHENCTSFFYREHPLKEE